MTPKEYLQQAYRLDEIIASDRRECNALRELAVSISSQNTSRDVVMRSRCGDAPFTGIVEKIAVFEDRIAAEFERYIALKLEIHSVIDAVPDSDERLCLRYRYIEFLSWDHIAEKMNYDRRHVFRIHGNALRHVKIP